MPVNGQRDACGRVYPHAKWGQDCGDRMGREKKAAGSAPPPAAQPQPQPPEPAPPAAPTQDAETERLRQEYEQQLKFLEEQRQRQGQFDQADYDRQMALLEEQKRKLGEFDQADYARQTQLLQEQLANETRFLEADFARQQQYIQQNAALSEQERQLALQQLETQLNFSRQQLALRMQQLQSDKTEELRQAPLRLRDIADQFASQGAFYSGKRQFTQDEAQHASNLAVQGLDRAMKGESLSGEEQEALAQIQRGMFGIEAQRIALEMQTQLGELQTNYEREKWGLDFDFRSQTGDMASDLARSQWGQDFDYRSQTGDLTANLERGKWEQDFDYRVGSDALLDAYEENKRRLQEAILGGDGEGKNLTKADLATMFRQGLIDENQFQEALTGLGYTPGAANLITLSEQAKGPLSAKGNGAGKQISQSQLETMYRQGLMSKKDYVKNLTGLGYSPEQAKALAASAKAKGPTGKMITKEDITTSYSLGVMSKEVAFKNLRSLGYDEYSANAILANAQAKKSIAAQREAESLARKSSGSAPKTATKSDLVSAYRNGLFGTIGSEEAQNRLLTSLRNVGYSSGSAKLIVADATAKGPMGGSSSTASKGTLAGPKATVNGIEISVNKGGALHEWSGVERWISDNRTTYNDLKEDMSGYVNQNSGTGNLAGFVSWFRSKLRSAGWDSTKANAWISDHANGISIVWYREFHLYGYGWAR